MENTMVINVFIFFDKFPLNIDEKVMDLDRPYQN